MTEEIVKNIREEEFYSHFIEECRSAMVEAKFNSQIEALKGKWYLGKRIVEEELNLNKPEYGKHVMEILADDLDISISHIFKVAQFYKKFQFEHFDKVIEQLPEGKAISWFKLCQNVLPKPRDERVKEERVVELQKDCTHPILKCVACGKKFTMAELLKKDEVSI